MCVAVDDTFSVRPTPDPALLRRCRPARCAGPGEVGDDVVLVCAEAGLVDRFRVVVFPVITGNTGQERIYAGYPDVALHMVNSRTFDGRIELLEYVPTVLEGPPGTNDADGRSSPAPGCGCRRDALA